ncbi:hypothetical protein [Bartonella rattimassiliensis]|uniref:hypothetical protein n=1 Tax=Bartonella rattimassiliensis TaxID=270250 RepID=UPI0002DD7A25|nr:hypothetical protein [Bartonella rattimassiliensis]
MSNLHICFTETFLNASHIHFMMAPFNGKLHSPYKTERSYVSHSRAFLKKHVLKLITPILQWRP